MTNSTTNRRTFMRRGVSMMVALPVLAGTAQRFAAAADQVDLADPTAVAISYVHDATTSSKRTDTSATCMNCQLYTGEAGSEWGPCALFPGKAVAGKGWCTAWVKKAG